MTEHEPSEPTVEPIESANSASEPDGDFQSEPLLVAEPENEARYPSEPDEDEQPLAHHEEHLPPPPVEEKVTFLELGLSHDVLRAIADVGYEHPTPIQAEAIPVVLMGRDVLGTAQTGTGKTASFTLPMIEILGSGRAKARMPRSLILEPTRELAAQVAENFDLYGKYHKLSKALLIGGESMDEQVRKLDRGVDVLIATPGRLLDLFERGRILLNDVKILVIDEADRMLDMGFIPDVEKIVSKLPSMRQTLFFSATMPPEIQRLVDTFLFSPKRISVAPPAAPAANVQQALIMVDELDKREALRRLLSAEDVKNAFIFCNRKKTVNILYRSLKRHGLDAAELHGDMSQPERMRTLDSFKKDEVRLLVCSDVAARGIDIQGVSHVYNFDLPFHAEDYVHRIGRTGRAGLSGRAYSLCTPEDAKFLAAIEQMLGKEIPRETIEGLAVPEMGVADGGEGRGRGRNGRDRGVRGGRERGDRPGRDRGRGREREKPSETEAQVVADAVVESAAPVAAHGVDPSQADQPEVKFEPALRSHREREPGRERGGRDRNDRDRNRDRGQDRGQDRDRGRDRGRRYGRDDDGDDTPVIGFGADIPAFMQRAVKLPPLRKPGELDESEIDDEVIEDEAPESPALGMIEEIEIPDDDEVDVLGDSPATADAAPLDESAETSDDDDADDAADEDADEDGAQEEPAQASEPDATREPPTGN
ncbi:MAG: DEAD/DEAH box helicase [Alphaproteobacteria bacterium]|nr:DEAD/DEAH box helicase [Alphaproteobacteria bacterium]